MPPYYPHHYLSSTIINNTSSITIQGSNVSSNFNTSYLYAETFTTQAEHILYISITHCDGGQNI